MRYALMTNIMKDFDDMFRAWPLSKDLSHRLERENAFFSPAVDVHETEKDYLLQFDLPGMNQKDVTLKVTGRELLVTGERKGQTEQDSKKTYRSERYFGHFERSFLLPEDVEASKIEAHFKDGVLQVKIPKLEKALPQEIPIQIQ